MNNRDYVIEKIEYKLELPVRVFNLFPKDSCNLEPLHQLYSDSGVRIMSLRNGIIDPGYIPAAPLIDADTNNLAEFRQFLITCDLIPDLLPQHLRQALKFMEPAMLVVIAVDADPKHVELAILLAKYSDTLGIDTIIFTPPGVTLPSKPILGTVFTQIIAASDQSATLWPRIVHSLILGITPETGIVCVDWEDAREVLRNSPISRWSRIEAHQIENVKSACNWLSSTVNNTNISSVMLIFQISYDANLMMLIKQIIPTIRRLIGPNGLCIFAAPFSNIEKGFALTLIWS